MYSESFVPSNLSTARSIQMFAFLNELYGRYDAVVAKFNVYKVETIGDCECGVSLVFQCIMVHSFPSSGYMCATGLIKDDPDHAHNMLRSERAWRIITLLGNGAVG